MPCRRATPLFARYAAMRHAVVETDRTPDTKNVITLLLESISCRTRMPRLLR